MIILEPQSSSFTTQSNLRRFYQFSPLNGFCKIINQLQMLLQENITSGDARSRSLEAKQVFKTIVVATFEWYVVYNV